MNIADISKAQALAQDLTTVRRELNDIGEGVMLVNGNFTPFRLSEANLDVFRRLATMELVEREQDLVDELAALGVDADAEESNVVETHAGLPCCEINLQSVDVKPLVMAIMSDSFGGALPR